MRYAMKREVAAHCGRFFRGVCPILNRAKEFEEAGTAGRARKADAVPFKGCMGFDSVPGVRLARIAGFLMSRVETPGTVVKNPARRRDSKEAVQTWQSRKK